MPGTSPDGWPYILDDDHPIEYPAYSQNLATLMDSRWDTYQSDGVLTPATGWADFGSGAAGMLVTRSGGIVTVEASLKRTSDLSITAGTPAHIATVPAGFVPTHEINFTGAVTLSTAMTACRIRITAGGLVQLIAFGSGALTVQANGLTSVAVTYRGA